MRNRGDSGIPRLITLASSLKYLLRDQLTPENDELNETGSTLEDGGESPRPVTVAATPVVSTDASPGNKQRTHVPETVINSGETSTVLRMAQLSEKHRRGNLSERVAETEKNTTARVGSVIGSSSLQTGANSHEDKPESDTRATSPAIGDNRDKRDRGD